MSQKIPPMFLEITVSPIIELLTFSNRDLLLFIQFAPIYMD